MSELIYSKTAASPACTLGIVEHKIGATDTTIYKMMRLAAQPRVKPFRLRLRWPFHHLNLNQSVAHEQSACNTGLDRFFVFATHDKAVHDRIHIPDARFIECNFF